jgi:hypothetical protein
MNIRHWPYVKHMMDLIIFPFQNIIFQESRAEDILIEETLL